MKKAIAGGCLQAALLSPVAAQQFPQGTTYYVPVGRIVGSSTNFGQGTTYFDAVGRAVGSSTNYGYQEQPFNAKPLQSEADLDRQVKAAFGLAPAPDLWDAMRR